jgi:hypothetical protein
VALEVEELVELLLVGVHVGEDALGAVLSGPQTNDALTRERSRTAGASGLSEPEAA